MAYVKPKYEGEDFLEWYKTHYGKDYDGSTLNRGEGMLDQDWEIGNALYGTYKNKLAREEQYNQDKTLLEQGYKDAQAVADNTYSTTKGTLEGDYSKNQAELLKNYQSSVASLDKSKNQSLQSASITYDKLKKYLPTQIKAQGLGGLGVSESTMLQAHNNYATQTGSIKNNYNENKTALEEAYGSNKANLDTAHESNMSTLESEKLASDTERKTTLDQSLAELLKYYNSDMQGMKADIGSITEKFFNQNKELQASNYADLAALIEGDLKTEDLATFLQRIESADIDDNQKALLKTLAESKVSGNANTLREQNREQLLYDLDVDYESASTVDEWNNALQRLETNKDLLDDQTYNYWKGKLQSKYDAAVQTKANDEQAETDKRILEGKEYVKYGGSEYKILSKIDKNANEITDNNSFTEQLKNLGYTNPYDKNIPNGTTLYINRDANGSDKTNFWDFVPIVHIWTISGTGTHNWHITYYNGEWYHSEKQ